MKTRKTYLHRLSWPARLFVINLISFQLERFISFLGNLYAKRLIFFRSLVNLRYPKIFQSLWNHSGGIGKGWKMVKDGEKILQSWPVSLRFLQLIVLLVKLNMFGLWFPHSLTIELLVLLVLLVVVVVLVY